MRQPIRITWTCPQCEDDTSVLVHPFIPAKLSGPPESCYEAEGGEIEPDCCEHCSASIPQDQIAELAADEYYGQMEAAAERLADERRDSNG